MFTIVSTLYIWYWTCMMLEGGGWWYQVSSQCIITETEDWSLVDEGRNYKYFFVEEKTWVWLLVNLTISHCHSHLTLFPLSKVLFNWHRNLVKMLSQPLHSTFVKEEPRNKFKCNGHFKIPAYRMWCKIGPSLPTVNIPERKPSRYYLYISQELNCDISCVLLVE